MNDLLRVRDFLQRWVAENHNNPDVPRIQSAIDILAKLAQTQEGTEVGKELLIRWVLGEFSLAKDGKELQP